MDGVVILSLPLVFDGSAVDLVMVVKSPIGLTIVGIAATIVGLLCIVFRRAIREAVVRAQTKSFGSAVGKRMESTKPWAFAAAGAIFIGMGVFCLVLLLF